MPFTIHGKINAMVPRSCMTVMPFFKRKASITTLKTAYNNTLEDRPAYNKALTELLLNKLETVQERGGKAYGQKLHGTLARQSEVLKSALCRAVADISNFGTISGERGAIRKGMANNSLLSRVDRKINIDTGWDVNDVFKGKGDLIPGIRYNDNGFISFTALNGDSYNQFLGYDKFTPVHTVTFTPQPVQTPNMQFRAPVVNSFPQPQSAAPYQPVPMPQPTQPPHLLSTRSNLERNSQPGQYAYVNNTSWQNGNSYN